MLKTHIILGGVLAPSVHPFSSPSFRFYVFPPPFSFFLLACLLVGACERSEAERGRPQARPEDHFGGITCASFVVGYHLGLTSALQHCQNNCAFRFLAAQVFIDFGVILGPVYISFFDFKKFELSFFVRFVSRSICQRFLTRHFDAWD